MRKKLNPRILARTKRHQRIRCRISGKTENPRLCVFRSAKHIYAQIIDDDRGQTVASASSLSHKFKQEMKTGGNIAAANLVGKLIAQEASVKGIKKVVFDRGGYLYHGRVKALAEAAREHGLVF